MERPRRVAAASVRFRPTSTASGGRDSVTTTSTSFPEDRDGAAAPPPARSARVAARASARGRRERRKRRHGTCAEAVGARGRGYTVAPRGCGGIGRRARFRSVWEQSRGGSSPLIRIAIFKPFRDHSRTTTFTSCAATRSSPSGGLATLDQDAWQRGFEDVPGLPGGILYSSGLVDDRPLRLRCRGRFYRNPPLASVAVFGHMTPAHPPCLVDLVPECLSRVTQRWRCQASPKSPHDRGFGGPGAVRSRPGPGKGDYRSPSASSDGNQASHSPRKLSSKVSFRAQVCCLKCGGHSADTSSRGPRRSTPRREGSRERR
jgi:hypothetical protein